MYDRGAILSVCSATGICQQFLFFISVRFVRFQAAQVTAECQNTRKVVRLRCGEQAESESPTAECRLSTGKGNAHSSTRGAPDIVSTFTATDLADLDLCNLSHKVKQALGVASICVLGFW